MAGDQPQDTAVVAPSAIRIASSRVPARRGRPGRRRCRSRPGRAPGPRTARAAHQETPAGQRFADARVHRADAEHRQLGIHGAQRLAGGGGQRRRIGAAADDDVHRPHRELGVRQVHRDARVAIERVLFHVADDADDRDPGRVVRHRRPAARAGRWRASRPELRRHALVDERDQRPRPPIAVTNSRPATSGIHIARNSRRPTKRMSALMNASPGARVRPSTRIGPQANIWLSGSAETPRPPRPREARNPAPQLAVGEKAVGALRIALALIVSSKVSTPAGSKPGGTAASRATLRTSSAAPDEQHHRERDLGDNEQPAQAVSAPPQRAGPAGAPAGVVERGQVQAESRQAGASRTAARTRSTGSP